MPSLETTADDRRTLGSMKVIRFMIPLIVSVCVVTTSPGLAQQGQGQRLHESHTSPSVPETPLVTQEIRYRAPEAGEVWLVWGVNGWKHVPESLRPPMTVIKDGVMHTPMAGKNDLFVATIAVHTGTIINYGFLTTKDRTNEAVRVWQGDGPSKDFSTVAKSDGTVEIPSTTAGAAPSPS